jgi:hypothetical protein
LKLQLQVWRVLIGLAALVVRIARFHVLDWRRLLANTAFADSAGG